MKNAKVNVRKKDNVSLMDLFGLERYKRDARVEIDKASPVKGKKNGQEVRSGMQSVPIIIEISTIK